MNIQLLNEAAAFVWQEADMLDHREYDDWLTQWSEDGIYIVPIDPDATNYEDVLNYAYDTGEMRAKRVYRLTSGESVSTIPATRTVRTLSRFRLLGEENGVITIRAAMNLTEFRKETVRSYAADVTYELVRAGDSFKMKRKVVCLVNSTDVLHAVAYIF